MIMQTDRQIRESITEEFMKGNKMDQISLIIAYEQGELSETQTLDLFSELIRSGLCWNLQGHYGRTAKSLIENGIIDCQGKILISI